jgi:phage-related baseplate assembly protein
MSTTVIDLSSLPTPDVVESLEFESILAGMVVDLQARAPELTALLESDPALKVLQVAAYRETLLRQRINDAARRRLLAFANGTDLDHLAAFYGVQRLMLDSGDPSAVPPVDPAYETDAVFRQRVRDRIMGSSAAGTAGWYRYHAMTADASIRDVAVDAPAGGTVRVTVLADTETGAPTAETLAAVADVVLSPSVRALCHAVQVVPAEVVPIDVAARITLQPSAQLALVGDVEATLRAGFAQAAGLGWDVTASWLIARLQVPGVHSVDLVAPAANVAIGPNQCATLGGVTLTYTGRDQ